MPKSFCSLKKLGFFWKILLYPTHTLCYQFLSFYPTNTGSMLQLAIKILLEYDSSSSLYRFRALFIASNIWLSHGGTIYCWSWNLSFSNFDFFSRNESFLKYFIGILFFNSKTYTFIEDRYTKTTYCKNRNKLFIKTAWESCGKFKWFFYLNSCDMRCDHI